MTSRHDHPLCDACREQAETIKNQSKQLADLEQRFSKLEKKHDKLAKAHDKLKRLHFGKQKPTDQNRRKKKAGKKKGQTGHGRRRPDKDEITNEEELCLETCPQDGHNLGPPIDTYDRIIEDIPLPHTPIITRWQIRRYWCSDCQKIVSGTVPGVIPGTRIGPNVLTYVLTQRHRFRNPIRLIAESLSIYYSFEISEGEINNLLDRGAKLLGPAYDEIVAAVKDGKHIHCDETGWYINGKKVWAWAFATAETVLYEIRPTRSTKVAAEVLGNKEDRTSIHDCYAGYFSAVPGYHQLCWSHVTGDSKDLVKQSKAGEEQQYLHKELTSIYRRLLKVTSVPQDQWNDSKAKRCRRTCETKIAQLQEYDWQDEYCRKLVDRLTRYQAALFTCTYEWGIPPDNNHAERVVRKVVIQRKISGGNRSVKGADNYAKTMSVLETFRLQGKDIIPSLQEALGRGLEERLAVATSKD